jgi:hypothetical protein
VYGSTISDFTKRTPEGGELGCKSCVKMKRELIETVSELMSAKEIMYKNLKG